MMRGLMCAGVLAVSVLGMAAGSAAQGPSEEAGARVPLENYLKGHATGDGAFMRLAFHPDAKICANQKGAWTCRTAEEFAAVFPGKPAPDEGQRKRSIESVTLTGDVGVATIVLDYPRVKYTDYMSLAKVNGEWKIYNKVYFAEPKTR
jgi:hypothetical protein